MGMTKFEDVNDPGFVAVAGELRRWSKELAQSLGPPSISQDKTAQVSNSASPLGQESFQGPHMENQSENASQETISQFYRGNRIGK
jgi:hypothetical protein